MTFIERAMACLRPGGVAVHTTEFNLGSNGKTLENAVTVAYRKRDMEALAGRLIAQGHSLPKINFAVGTSPDDQVVDLPPFKSPIHLKVLVRRHLLTSIGLHVISR